MHRTLLTHSEEETQEFAADLAKKFFAGKTNSFLSLTGTLGSGKSTFARGFISKWCSLSNEPEPESIVSPTYNIARVYGKALPIAHLDLYRLRSMQELEQLGFEHYFYDFKVCLVEWLDHLPEALAFAPASAVLISFEMGDKSNTRKIELKIQV
jgi:tRNA threonylcarbamoyl adenosine modification protein YjeE